jgi:hypothetical protein
MFARSRWTSCWATIDCRLAQVTDQEYWRDYKLIRDDVSVAIRAFYTYIEAHKCAENNRIYKEISKEAPFWQLQPYGLQATFFIVLGRIFDKDKDAHSIRKFINATVQHKGYFSKHALANRKSTPQGKPDWLDDFVQQAHEPSVKEIEALSEALKPHEEKYKSVYGPIRHQVFAHTALKDSDKVSALFSRTQISDIEDTLYFLQDLLEAIWQLGHNGIKPILGTRSRDYEDKNRAKQAARRVLESLS